MVLRFLPFPYFYSLPVRCDEPYDRGMSSLQKRFGSLVAGHRRRLRLTQRQLAEATDLSEDMIARIETGSTGASFNTITSLAQALGVDPAALFSPEHPSTPARGELIDMLADLSKLNDGDLQWLRRIIDAALSSNR